MDLVYLGQFSSWEEVVFFSQCNTQVPSTQVNLCYVENANLNQMILAYNY